MVTNDGKKEWKYVVQHARGLCGWHRLQGGMERLLRRLHPPLPSFALHFSPYIGQAHDPETPAELPADVR